MNYKPADEMSTELNQQKPELSNLQQNDHTQNSCLNLNSQILTKNIVTRHRLMAKAQLLELVCYKKQHPCIWQTRSIELLAQQEWASTPQKQQFHFQPSASTEAEALLVKFYDKNIRAFPFSSTQRAHLPKGTSVRA